MKTIFKFWWIPLIAGLFFILVGLMIIQKPVASFYSMSMLIGILLVATGTAEIYLFTYHRKKIADWNWHLSGGLLDLLLGMILILSPRLILIGITILISLWLFYKTYVAVKKALALKEQKNKNWIWVLIVGVLILSLAIFLILKPEIIGAALSYWIAIAFIGFGALRIYVALILRKSYKNFE